MYSRLLELFDAGKFREVIDIVNNENISISQEPSLAQIVAGSYFRIGEYAKCMELLDLHLSIYDSDGSYLSLYGAACRRLGQLGRARQFFKKALSVNPLSIPIRNNYANLLIDLDEFSESRQILDSILLEDSSFTDAIENLNRLNYRESLLSKIDPVTQTTDIISGSFSKWQSIDPLMAAFSDEEVVLAGAVKYADIKPKSSLSLLSELPKPDKGAKASEQLKLASRAVQENNPSFSLQLISQAATDLGAHQSVYMNAADAYIRLERFREAEICYLQCIQIGGKSVPAYINLSSLALLRKDFSLAKYYIDQVVAIDPSNPNLARMRDEVQKQQSMIDSPFVFQPKWENPSLVSVDSSKKS